MSPPPLAMPHLLRALPLRLGRWLACGGLMVAGLVAPGRAMLPFGHGPEFVESWGMDKGLPQAGVTAVIQTRDDYLWVGTAGGLARFDGMRFTTFRTANTAAMTSHVITALFEDRAGTLWIGTENGLLRYRDGVFAAAGLGGGVVGGICETAEGEIWVISDDSVQRQRGGGFEPVSDPAFPRGAIQSIFADSSGRIWIGFEAGVVCRQDGTFQRVDAGMAWRDVRTMAESPRGTLWFGTADGLVRWKEGRFLRRGVAEGLAARRVNAVLADPDGGLWVATSTLQKISGEDARRIDSASPSLTGTFSGLCKDREGNLWIGAAGEGLLRMRPAPFQLMGLDARNVASGFRTVMQDGAGTIWLAQGTLGYTRITRETEVVRSLPGADTEAGEVLAVYVSRSGALWVGGREALQLTRNGRTELYRNFGGVRTIFEDRQGRMWFGRQNLGVTRWEDDVFTQVELPAKAAACTPASFAETSTGVLWIGTWTHGALRLRGDEVAVFDRESGLATTEMRCVYVDREDRVWAGTRGWGLAVFDGSRWIMPEWTSELIDQQVISLIEDEADNLWLAAPRGVFMVSRTELWRAMNGELPLNRLRLTNAMSEQRQEVADLACFPSVWRTREGHLWFATRRGVMRIDPARLQPNRRPPTVHIERVLVNGQRLPAADEIVLSPDTRGLAIEYTALSFSAPSRVRFQYRLEGVDDDWIDDDRRMAHYAKLPPGRYRFQVIASNADGVWNDRGATLAIVQQAHLYQRPWVWWTLGVALIAGATGAYRWRVATHARERRRLEAGIAERTRELQLAKEHAEASTRAKAEFLESISHEIRNPLNGIVGLVAMLREAQLDERERELAQSLGACAKGLVRVFDEVLNFSRLEHGFVTMREAPFALGPLVDEVAALFRMMARQRGSEIVVRREGEVPEHWVGDAEKIKSILGNFVSNALKYAPGSPVDILVECDGVDEFGADLTFNVADRGPGIPPEEQEQIFEKFVRGSTARTQRAPGTGLGLATCRALAELMGGHVAVESEPGGGATFFLRVRLKRDRNPAPVNARPPEAPALATGRALIVEDQAYNQLVVRRIAERLGFASDVARDAAEALTKFGRHAYAIVFVDWELPDLSGDELARRIRALPEGREAIVIATTAHDSDEIRRRCEAAGMDGFALKPFETETIARLIRDARVRRGAPADGLMRLDTRVFRFVGYDDPEEAGQAARLYLDILDREVAMLQGALRQEDSASAAAVAHRIKSHAGLVDAVDLRETADRLQRSARSAPTDVLAELHQELIRHAGALRERLKSWRDEDAAD